MIPINELHDLVQNTPVGVGAIADLFTICHGLVEHVADLQNARSNHTVTHTIEEDHIGMMGRDIVALMGRVSEIEDRKASLRRDQFAAAAVAGLLVGDYDPAQVAREAYEIADAMITERTRHSAENTLNTIGGVPRTMHIEFADDGQTIYQDVDLRKPHRFILNTEAGGENRRYRICKCGISEPNTSTHPPELQRDQSYGGTI